MHKFLNNFGSAYGGLQIFKRAMDATRKVMNIEDDYAKLLLQGKAYDNLSMFKEAIKS